MNRRRALLWLLPLAAAAVPVAELLARPRRGGVRPAGGAGSAGPPNVVLRTQDGAQLRLRDDLLHGRTALVTFPEPGCADPACVATTENLARLGRALGDRCGRDVFLYAIVKQSGGRSAGGSSGGRERLGLGPGWTILTASARDLDLCRRGFGLGGSGGGHRGEAPHANAVVLGNEPHQRWLAAAALADPEVLIEKLDRVAGIRS